MAKRGKKIDVIGKIGEIQDLRAQLAQIAKRKGTSIPEAALKLDLSKQRLYGILAEEHISEEQLLRILKTIKASVKDLTLRGDPG